jgi:hypothetical protein
MANALTRRIVRDRAIALRNLRKLILTLLYPSRSAPGDNTALRALANTFSRYASTQQTAYESGVAASSSGSTSQLDRQVRHAIAQVIGRSPGSGSGLGTALVDAFPTLGDGTIGTSPTRSVVSMTGTGPAAYNGSNAAGLSGQISAEQATLYRQASLIVPDARTVLAGLQPFATVAQPDVVESLRGLIDTALQTLLEEFGRVDEPRAALVDDYLASIDGKTGFIRQLGDVAKIDGTSAFPDTLDDERQVAGWKLLKGYVRQLEDAWRSYRGAQSVQFPNFSQRTQLASQMLEVIGAGNVNLMSAMDSVGFTETERRSPAARFSTLGLSPAAINPIDPTSVLSSPDGEQTLKDELAGNLRYSMMTVDDFTQWVDKLARTDGPRLLTDAGQYGLEFVTAQADTLFYTLVPVLFATKLGGADLNSSPIVAQVLKHERVSWALDDLVSQLDTLAGLAAA